MINPTEIAKIESEQLSAIDSEVKAYIAKRATGPNGGWTVIDHAHVLTALAADIADSKLADDEIRLRLYITFRSAANYSAFRQKYERAGLLTPGSRKDAAGLASEYLNSI